MFCPECGKEMAPEAKFCPFCGKPVPTAAAPASGASAPSAAPPVAPREEAAEGLRMTAVLHARMVLAVGFLGILFSVGITGYAGLGFGLMIPSVLFGGLMLVYLFLARDKFPPEMPYRHLMHLAVIIIGAPLAMLIFGWIPYFGVVVWLLAQASLAYAGVEIIRAAGFYSDHHLEKLSVLLTGGTMIAYGALYVVLTIVGIAETGFYGGLGIGSALISSSLLAASNFGLSVWGLLSTLIGVAATVGTLAFTLFTVLKALGVKLNI